MTTKQKRTSDVIGRLIVDGINEQLRLHNAQFYMVFVEIGINRPFNMAKMTTQFMNTNLNVVLPFLNWSDWCRLTMVEPTEYRWYGEMEALARQMIDLWKVYENRMKYSAELDRLVAEIEDKPDGN